MIRARAMKLIFFAVMVLAFPQSFAKTASHAKASLANTEIDWRLNGMDKALAEAKQAKKPLLVFWGAVWCPPCNALKAKAFHDSLFVAATRPFVAVYLDGDSNEAQTWGEHFQASGYPTLLVLNPDGQEVQRIVTTDSIPDLIAELNQTRDDLSSYDDLLAQATHVTGLTSTTGATNTADTTQATPTDKTKVSANLSAQSWKRLATRDWLNDERWHDHEAELADKLEKIALVFPKDKELSVDRERELLQSYLARAAALKDKESLPEAQRNEWRAHLSQLLENPTSVQEQAAILSESADSFTHAIFPKEALDPERDAFITKYLDAFRAFRKTKDLTPERRMYSLSPFTELSHASNKFYPELSKAESASLKEEVDQKLRGAKSQENLIIALDTLAQIYIAIGLPADAEKMVIANLPRLNAKNEMMSLIAELESKQNHLAEALIWREKAYREAQGGATHLQWGVSYIRHLTTEEPKSFVKIEHESQELLADSLKRSDTFSGRNWRSVNRLTKALQEWEKAQKIELASSKIIPKAASCSSTGAASEAHSRCERFLLDLKAL